MGGVVMDTTDVKSPEAVEEGPVKTTAPQVATTPAGEMVYELVRPLGDSQRSHAARHTGGATAANDSLISVSNT